jgi:hypothetical protein
MSDAPTATIVSIDAVRRDQQIAEALLPDAPVPDFIKPRSIADMTDTEQETMLIALRTRRLEAIQKIQQMQKQKADLSSANSRIKLEKKLEQIKRQEEKTLAAIDKLEELIFQGRALALQLGG